MMAIINDVTGVAGRAGISDHPQIPADGKRKSKKRIRAFTSEDRASHRSIEKQRREALNQSFLELARLLPPLAHARRLSKSLIINESISYLNEQRAIRLAAASEIRDLLADYNSLITQLNARQYPHVPGETQQLPRRIRTKALLELMDVEQEEFGTFPGGFGDNGPYDDVEGDQSREIDYFVTQADNLDFTNVLDNPTNFPSTKPNGLMDAATATLPDSIATQLPLNILQTNTTNGASTQQRELNPSHHLTIPNSLATEDIMSLNDDLLDNLLPDNEWPLDILFEPTFHSDTGSAQLLYNNSVSLSQFHGQHHPGTGNGDFGFIQ
ncbi:hypothetical protein V500_06821 [Pseudogymnoascus sp. VKM F-4518 (FW-2643)]|nr:hypothetical protein V500_06821 [Pseudogymnoascus sp. VKM F-4518 (FW-2643)]